jgi:hypothetical protein
LTRLKSVEVDELHRHDPQRATAHSSDPLAERARLGGGEPVRLLSLVLEGTLVCCDWRGDEGARSLSEQLGAVRAPPRGAPASERSGTAQPDHDGAASRAGPERRAAHLTWPGDHGRWPRPRPLGGDVRGSAPAGQDGSLARPLLGPGRRAVRLDRQHSQTSQGRALAGIAGSTFVGEPRRTGRRATPRVQDSTRSRGAATPAAVRLDGGAAVGQGTATAGCSPRAQQVRAPKGGGWLSLAGGVAARCSAEVGK